MFFLIRATAIYCAINGAAALAGEPRLIQRTALPRRAATASPTLMLQPCNASQFQIFEIVNNTVQWSSGDTPLCVTFDAAAGYDSPLILTSCITNASNQSWVYAGTPSSLFSNPVDACAGPGGVCLSWSGQEAGTCVFTPPALGPGCRIGTWTASTSWNNQFILGGLAGAGTIEALWASATGPSPSGVCATVTVPAPPVPPTADILAWSKKEVMCLYGKC